MLASTYLGGTGGEHGYSLTLDTSGNVYVAGYTSSSDFPTTVGTYDTSKNGSSDTRYSGSSANADVFVSKLDSDLKNLLASTYLEGSDGDYCHSMAIDTSGNIYLTGYTQSSDFPVTTGAYDTSKNGSSGDVFISKLNGNLTNLLASTYLGGSGDDSGYSLGRERLRQPDVGYCLTILTARE